MLSGHFQNSYVTHDLDRAMEIFSRQLGVDHFDRFDPDMIVKTPHGERPLSIRVASTWLGRLNIELIEPVSGFVDHYASLLPTDRTDPQPRFHHISVRRDDEKAMREEVASLGLPLAFEGPMTIKGPVPKLLFIYLDARPALGHYLEFSWKSAEGWRYVGWPEGQPAI
jgi:hypothetical protein